MCEQKALGLVAAAASAGRRYSPNRFGLLERLFYSGSYKWNHTQGRAFFSLDTAEPSSGKSLPSFLPSQSSGHPVFLEQGTSNWLWRPLEGNPCLPLYPSLPCEKQPLQSCNIRRLYALLPAGRDEDPAAAASSA